MFSNGLDYGWLTKAHLLSLQVSSKLHYLFYWSVLLLGLGQRLLVGPTAAQFHVKCGENPPMLARGWCGACGNVGPRTAAPLALTYTHR